ncbi:hypothetical protein BJL95_17910 [Methylomonas sp. LWB]|nr:hypothetical protein BJL95_17910 [Methylomonas sp. LWB]
MRLQHLPFQEVNSRLRNSGLNLQLGQFCFAITTKLASVAQSLSILYADFEVFDSSVFVDFPVSVASGHNWFSSISKSAEFRFDGYAPFNPLPLQHAPALIEWGMNWCVSSQINTFLIIHAAVIEKNGWAAVLPAPPGSGKSTLTATLIQEGWRLLSDELTLVDPVTFRVHPFPRPVSLKNQSIDIVAKRYPGLVFGPLSTDTSKGTVCHLKPPETSVSRQSESCPIAWIIFPKYEAGSATEFAPKAKSLTFIDVADNAFNFSRLGYAGFYALRNVLDRASCYQLRYSCLDDAVQIFDQLKSAE